MYPLLNSSKVMRFEGASRGSGKMGKRRIAAQLQGKEVYRSSSSGSGRRCHKCGTKTPLRYTVNGACIVCASPEDTPRALPPEKIVGISIGGRDVGQ